MIFALIKKIITKKKKSKKGVFVVTIDGITNSKTNVKTSNISPNLFVFSIPIFLGIVCKEIASYLTSLISNGVLKQSQIKTFELKKIK